MPSKTKRTKRPKINCQYLEEQFNPIRLLRRVESEFTCPGCGSVLRQGSIFYCDLCLCELGPCCHPDFSEVHKNHDGLVDRAILGDYLLPKTCDSAGHIRCMCCERMLCLIHARKANISHLSIKDWRDRTLDAVVLCPNCKKRLDPEQEPEPSEFDDPDDEHGFDDEYDLRNFLDENGFNEYGV